MTINIGIISGWAHDSRSLESLERELSVSQPQSVRLRVSSVISAEEILKKLLIIGPSPEELSQQIAIALEQSLPSDVSCLIGWSLGGMFSLALAAHLPERCRSLTLISSAAKFVSDGSYVGANFQHLCQLKTKLLKNREEALFEFMSLCYSDREKLARTQAELCTWSQDTLAFGLEVMEQLDLRGLLPQIRVPLKMLHGKRDRIMPVATSRYLEENSKVSELTLLSKQDHGLPVTDPCLVVSEIHGFLKKFSELSSVLN